MPVALNVVHTPQYSFFQAVAQFGQTYRFGRFTTAGEIDYAIEHVVSAVKQLRELSPFLEQAREKGAFAGVEWTRIT